MCFGFFSTDSLASWKDQFEALQKDKQYVFLTQCLQQLLKNQNDQEDWLAAHFNIANKLKDNAKKKIILDLFLDSIKKLLDRAEALYPENAQPRRPSKLLDFTSVKIMKSSADSSMCSFLSGLSPQDKELNLQHAIQEQLKEYFDKTLPSLTAILEHKIDPEHIKVMRYLLMVILFFISLFCLPLLITNMILCHAVSLGLSVVLAGIMYRWTRYSMYDRPIDKDNMTATVDFTTKLFNLQLTFVLIVTIAIIIWLIMAVCSGGLTTTSLFILFVISIGKLTIPVTLIDLIMVAISTFINAVVTQCLAELIQRKNNKELGKVGNLKTVIQSINQSKAKLNLESLPSSAPTADAQKTSSDTSQNYPYQVVTLDFELEKELGRLTLHDNTPS